MQRNQCEQGHEDVKLLLTLGASDKRYAFGTRPHIMYFPGGEGGWPPRGTEIWNYDECKKEKKPEVGIIINRFILLGFI